MNKITWMLIAIIYELSFAFIIDFSVFAFSVLTLSLFFSAQIAIAFKICA